MKYIIHIVIFLISLQGVSAQEIIYSEVFRSNEGVIAEPEEIVIDNGKYYIPINEYRYKGAVAGLEIDSFFQPEIKNGTIVNSSLILEYTPGEGLTDYILLKHSEEVNISIHGDNIASCSQSEFFLGVGDSLIFSPQDTLADYLFGDEEDGCYFCPSTTYAMVFNKQEEILFLTNDLPHNSEPSIVIDDTYAYLLYSIEEDHVFLGDSVFLNYDEYPGAWVLHKINYLTGEKLWTKGLYAGFTLGGYYDMNIDEEGNLTFRAHRVVDLAIGDTILLDDGSYEEFIPNDNLIKISADGDFLEHAPISYPYNVTALEYVDYEANGDVIFYGWTRNNAVIKLEKDTFEIDGGERGTGVVMKFDNELNLLWYNTYSGSKIVSARGANNDMEGNMIISTFFTDSVSIDGEVFTNDNPFNAAHSWRSENILTKHDTFGDLVGTPYKMGSNSYVRDIITIAKDHYLILQQSHTSSRLSEVKGDIFEIMTALDEIEKKRVEKINVYPNPIHQNEDVLFELEDINRVLGIIIYDINGQIILNDLSQINKITNSTYSLSSEGIPSGIFILELRTEDTIYTSKLIIK